MPIMLGLSGPEMKALTAALLGPSAGEPPTQTEVQTARAGELSEAR